MKDNMTYRKARKLNAAFLLLLFATDNTTNNSMNTTEETSHASHGSVKTPQYFEEKLREYERDKYRF